MGWCLADDAVVCAGVLVPIQRERELEACVFKAA
jgi:hypothetical protein